MSDQNLPYRLSLLKIPVSDIPRAAAFYRDTLKLTEAFVAEEYGWAQFSAGDLPVGLYRPGQGGGDGHIGGSTGFHLALPPAAFDALAAELLAAGVLVEDRVHRGDDGSIFVHVRDPDGNVVHVSRIAEA